MADLGSALQGRNLHYWMPIEVMDDDVLLVLLDECCRCRWRNVAEGAVGYRRARFCRDVIACKYVQALGSGVRDDTGCRRTGGRA